MTTFWLMVYEFMKLGLFAVGGGLVALPFLQNMALTYGWFDSAMLADMVAVSESTPGPIGINMATYVGFSMEGVVGGVAASVAMLTAPFIIAMVVFRVLDTFKENKYVKAAFYSIRPAVTALIAYAGVSLLGYALFSTAEPLTFENFLVLLKPAAVGLGVVLFALHMRFKKWHPAILIGMGALGGIVLGL